jgi:hypothetical protein
MFAPIRPFVARTIFLTAAVAVLGASAARAQNYGYTYGRSWEITAFNGYYIASDLYNAISYNASVQLSNSYTWGGRLGFNPNPRVGLEFAYTRAGSDVTVSKSALGFNPGPLGRLNLNSYDINFLFNQHSMGSPRTTGFFTMGFGWTVTDPSGLKGKAGQSVSSKSLFAWNFGLGTKIAMNPSLALRLEGRWKITDTNVTTSSGVWCDYYGYCYNYSSSIYNSGELTAGLTFTPGQKH